MHACVHDGAWHRQADPQESRPLHVTEEEEVAGYRALLQEKMADIEGTMHSVVDYSMRHDPMGWPCCSAAQPDCGCEAK